MTLNFEYQQQIVQSLLTFVTCHKRKQPLRVLMLGMGGGSMAHHLYHTLPQMQMTVVELRQSVIDCAYRFFQLPDEPEIDVIQDDAIAFVSSNQHPFDVIIVDIFDAQGLPSSMSDPDFMNDLWQSLTSPGNLIFNLWFEWNHTQANGSPIPTEEAELILQYWQRQAQQFSDCRLNRYNIQSSQNLILELERGARVRRD